MINVNNLSKHDNMHFSDVIYSLKVLNTCKIHVISTCVGKYE